MVKVHRVEVLIVDFDDLGAEEIGVVLENTRYPNRCISPSVIKESPRKPRMLASGRNWRK